MRRHDTGRTSYAAHSFLSDKKTQRFFSRGNIYTETGYLIEAANRGMKTVTKIESGSN